MPVSAWLGTEPAGSAVTGQHQFLGLDLLVAWGRLEPHPLGLFGGRAERLSDAADSLGGRQSVAHALVDEGVVDVGVAFRCFCADVPGRACD